jgi:hypothetical protein
MVTSRYELRLVFPILSRQRRKSTTPPSAGPMADRTYFTRPRFGGSAAWTRAGGGKWGGELARQVLIYARAVGKARIAAWRANATYRRFQNSAEDVDRSLR